MRCLLSESKKTLNIDKLLYEKDENGWSVLHHAVKSKDELGLNSSLLIEYGANVEDVNNVGREGVMSYMYILFRILCVFNCHMREEFCVMEKNERVQLSEE